MRRKPTIGEVAKVANVAASTVSRVLNGGYASPEVKAKVQKVVRDLGYSPSPTARNLKMGRTGIIGVVVETIEGAWFNQLLAGIEEEVVEEKRSIALGSLKLHGDYDSSVVQAWIHERRIDGLILARAGKTERALVRAAAKNNIPLAFVGPDESFDVGQTFRTRNAEAGREVVEHLIALGHQTIAFAGGPNDSIDTLQRLDGVREGLDAHGLRLQQRHVWFGADYMPARGIEYAQRWLRLKPSSAPTAVVTGNDSMALGFMRTVLSAGRRVPQDVAVAGFDGIPEGALFWPGLTTAEQQTRLIGRHACESILKQLKEPLQKGQSAIFEYPTTLQIRESTVPRAGDAGSSTRRPRRAAG